MMSASDETTDTENNESTQSEIKITFIGRVLPGRMMILPATRYLGKGF